MSRFFKYFVVVFILAHKYSDVTAAQCPRYIVKRAWSKDYVYNLRPLETIPRHVVIHQAAYNGNCSSFDECIEAMKKLRSTALSKGFNDIQYNFCIGSDGRIYEGRGWYIMGSHAKGYNKKSIGIGLIAKFTKGFPSQITELIENFTECAVTRNLLTPTFTFLAHIDINTKTSCPGLITYKAMLQWDRFQHAWV